MTNVEAEFTLINKDGFTNDDGRHFEPFGDCYDYNKHCNSRGKKITGRGIYLNCSQYAVIDVDFHIANEEQKKQIRTEASAKEILEDEEQKIQVREEMINALKDINVKIVRTRLGGLHIYSKWDNSLSPGLAREVDFYENDKPHWSVDLFTPIKPKSTSVLCLPDSMARGKEGIIGKYEWIRHCDDSILAPTAEVVNALKKFINFEKVAKLEKRKASKGLSFKDEDDVSFDMTCKVSESTHTID